MKRFILCLLAVVLTFALSGPAEVLASDPLTNHLTNWPYMEDLSVDSAVLIDADNGAILYSLNRDTKRFPASITKVMTCLLVLENTRMDEVVTMTETGMAEAYGGSSNVDPVLGEQFTVEQCLYMLMLKSANDIASQLAEYVGGSVAGFADMMNQRAAALGCTGTHFHNANGLPDEEHFTTAYDMALIMREALKNEEFRKIAGTISYSVAPTNKKQETRIYENHFRLIVPSHERYYENAICGKTGYTNAALRTLIGAAQKDGRTLVAVTMHGPSKDDFLDMTNLFEYGFNRFKTLDVSAADGSSEGTVTIPNDFSLEQLSPVETESRIDYYYEELFVGGADRKALPTPSVTETPAEESPEASLPAVSEVSEVSELSAGQELSGRTEEMEEKKAGSGKLLPVLLVLAAILAGIIAYKRYLDAEREKKRKRRRKRNSEKREDSKR
ncbi:MAG: D-alanyl-D-alanine carboxypeptidase [Lachnospiraceae bacterium]|nr:D-alanyl-D-alanine carboxypeptidase [Lachnospiraceae bacterium]